MAIAERQVNQMLRDEYIDLIIDLLLDKIDTDVLRIESNTIAIPVVDANMNEKYIKIVVSVPTGKKDEPFNGYDLAEDYEFKLKEKEEKAKEKEKKKKEKSAE